MEQKAVLKLDLHDEKDKKKAMKIVSGFAGVDSISLNMKDGKLTVTGDFDPVHLVEKLRKLFPTTTLETVGPAKEEKKGNDPAKDNDGNKKGDDKNNNDGGKDQKGGGGVGAGLKIPVTYYPPYPYQSYTPRPAPPLYYDDQYRSIEEDPNGCVIC